VTEKLVLHEYAASGNCHKVRLTAAIVGEPLDRREYDIAKGETRTPEFLANINANGRIPVLQAGRRLIPESNAACYFIADGTSLIPTDRFEHADMLHWMFWEQYNHEPNLATLRSWMHSIGLENVTEVQRLQVPTKKIGGNAALKLMDDHLAEREWFVGDAMTLADICLFPYTSLAGDAEFDLKRYPNVVRWLERVKGQPCYVPIDA
jgi:glutathione S-transferase